MMSKTIFVTILGTAAFVSAIGLPAEARPLTPLEPLELQLRTAELTHQPWDGKSITENVSRKSGCWYSTEKIDVWDPITGQGLRYSVQVQRPVVNYKVPVVVIVPTIKGTHALLEPQMANALCNSKIASIIADINDPRQPTPLPAWGYEDVNNRRAILALKTIIDWAQKVTMFDANKVGMLGISLGGITTAMMTGVEPRLKASVVLVGAGNLPFILATGDDKRIAKLRSDRMRAANVPNTATYEEILRKTVKYDPFYFAPQARRSSILMIMGETDTAVPYRAQRELFDAYGGTNSITYRNGHVGTILSVSYLYMNRVTEFFQRKFSENFAESLLSGGSDAIQNEVVDLDQLGL